MNICWFIFALSLVSLVHSRGVKLDLAKVPVPMNENSVENSNSFSWNSCASDNSMAAINTLDINLNGYIAAVDIDVTLGEEVSGGTVSVTIYYNGFKLIQESMSLCGIVEQAGESCPISAGEYKQTAEFDIPSIPCGSYTGYVSVTDQNGSSLGCINFDMELSC